MNFSEHRGRLFIGSLIFIILAVTSPQTLHATIFKWKDKKGKTHFTDDRLKIPPQFRQEKPHFTPAPAKAKASSTEKISDETDNIKPQPSDGLIETFYAMDRTGQKKAIKIEKNTALFAVATWCHYSKRFINYLNAPQITAKMKDLNLIFVFKDEWPTIKRNLGKSVAKGEITQAQANKQLTYLKQKAKGEIVYDPTFINDLPSKHYFVTERFTKLKNIYPTSIPRAYSPSQNSFENSITQWIKSHFKNQKATKAFLVAEYKKYSQGEK